VSYFESQYVDIRPYRSCQLISELADTVAVCLLDLADLSSGLKFESSDANDIFIQQIMTQRTSPSGPFRDLENNLRTAVLTRDTDSIADCVCHCDLLAKNDGGKTIVTRILWNVIVEAPSDMADLILSTLPTPFDFHFVDDINGRTCLHEAAIAGNLRLVDLCVQNGVRIDQADLYGRTALHYASMKGHPAVCQRLLETHASPDVPDRDNYSPLVYATMKGNVDCVRVLLIEGNVSVELTKPLGDLIPLSLASQSGHVDVVLLLLENKANCLPNTNGEYPMHLAAREGHVEVCKVLTNCEGWDTPDKYYEWSPLFHAARYGRDACVEVLLEAGARVDATDELGHLAVHYAAWYGHQQCLALLLEAARSKPSSRDTVTVEDSPVRSSGVPENDIDHIPSLSLPPPIMPHRVYGHNYLDKIHLVQITIGHFTRRPKNYSGVRIHHRLICPAFEDEYLRASTPLKLVMTTSPHVNSAPYSVSLPLRGERKLFAFHIGSLDDLSLEFSIYPNFGTKTIGRAIALPSLFADIENNQAFTLPILDVRLHVVGEVIWRLSYLRTSFTTR
jgi:CDK inhibitor PHO81